jgi:hypothetical protein
MKSNQCCEHPKTVFKDGPNQIFKRLIDEQAVTWGMIKDTGVDAPMSLELVLDAERASLTQKLAEIHDKMQKFDDNEIDYDALVAAEAEKQAQLSANRVAMKKATAQGTTQQPMGPGGLGGTPRAQPEVSQMAARKDIPMLNQRRAANNTTSGLKALDEKSRFLQNKRAGKTKAE